MLIVIFLLKSATRARERFGDKYSYRDVVYVNNDTLVKIFCKEHRRVFMTTPDNHLYGGSGCPLCSESTGEIDIRLWLEAHHINFHYQYKVPNMNRALKLKYLLVDFYLPDYRIYLEFHGAQHYEDIPHFYRKSKRTFPMQQLRDATLRDYCQRFGISLYEIPYTKQKLIPAFLQKILFLSK